MIFWQMPARRNGKAVRALFPAREQMGDSKRLCHSCEPGQTGRWDSANTPWLLMSPQNRFNGYIQGFYPTLPSSPATISQSTAGCEYGYQAAMSPSVSTIWLPTATSGLLAVARTERWQIYNADVDLTPLAGRSVRFILTMLATGNATNDRVEMGCTAHCPRGRFNTSNDHTCLPLSGSHTPTSSMASSSCTRRSHRSSASLPPT